MQVGCAHFVFTVRQEAITSRLRSRLSLLSGELWRAPLLCQQNGVGLDAPSVSLSQKRSSLYTPAVTACRLLFLQASDVSDMSSWNVAPREKKKRKKKHASVCRKCGRVPDTLTHLENKKTSCWFSLSLSQCVCVCVCVCVCTEDGGE